MTESLYEITLTEQKKKSLETLAALRSKVIKADASLKLDCIFRSNTSKKATE